MLTRNGNTRLCLTGPDGSFECTWTQFSLFRDNAQHHLEGGMPSGQFPALHQAADLLGSAASTALNALQIRDEICWVFGGLRHLPMRELAMSIRTAAILVNAWPLPPANGTVLLRIARWPLPSSLENAVTLGGVFGGIAHGLNRITSRASAQDSVWIVADSRTTEETFEPSFAR